MRFGHRPKVADTFCGAGSIPFEAARVGCDVYASDLNPIACMLTWGALHLIGGGDRLKARLEAAQKRVTEAVDERLAALESSTTVKATVQRHICTASRSGVRIRLDRPSTSLASYKQDQAHNRAPCSESGCKTI